MSKTRANVGAFYKWLDSVQLTKPITLEDKAELKKLVKQALVAIDVRVDVYSKRDPDEVYLRIEYPDRHIVERTYRGV